MELKETANNIQNALSIIGKNTVKDNRKNMKTNKMSHEFEIREILIGVSY